LSFINFIHAANSDGWFVTTDIDVRQRLRTVLIKLAKSDDKLLMYQATDSTNTRSRWALW